MWGGLLFSVFTLYLFLSATGHPRSQVYLKPGSTQPFIQTINPYFFAINEDLDEMLEHAAFHLGLHCLPKNL